MAISGANSRRERGAPSTEPVRSPPISGPQAPLGPTLALTVALAIGLFVPVLGLALILTSPTPLPPPLGEQEQDVETALYLAVFALILPAALIAVPRLADAIAAGPNAGALSLLVAFLVATLAVAILVVRVLPGGGGVVEALGRGRDLVARGDRSAGARDTGASVDTAPRGRPPGTLRLGVGRRPRLRRTAGLHLSGVHQPASGRAGCRCRPRCPARVRPRWPRLAAPAAPRGVWRSTP